MLAKLSVKSAMIPLKWVPCATFRRLLFEFCQLKWCCSRVWKLCVYNAPIVFSTAFEYPSRYNCYCVEIDLSVPEMFVSPRKGAFGSGASEAGGPKGRPPDLGLGCWIDLSVPVEKEKVLALVRPAWNCRPIHIWVCWTPKIKDLGLLVSPSTTPALKLSQQRKEKNQKKRNR